MNSSSLAIATRIGVLMFGVALCASRGLTQETDVVDKATAQITQRLDASVKAMNALRQQISNEKLPLARQLAALDTELSTLRQQYQEKARLIDSRNLDLSNLKTELKTRQDEATYLGNLLSEYIRNFESRLHIAELQRYREALDKAKLAAENTTLAPQQQFQTQVDLLGTSMDRIEDVLGGTVFKGTAVGQSSLVNDGTFLMVGPAAIFRSADGKTVGTVEQRLGSLEPTAIDYRDPKDVEAAASLIQNGNGELPVDPTGGDAHKIAATEETFLEHIKKGGPVMYPIFIMAGLALLIAAIKWVSLLMIRSPGRKQMRKLLDAVGAGDRDAASKTATAMPGPTGQMLAAGTEQMHRPRELVEEVMYESVLKTRLRVQRFLAFIAICAAAAPLLGLLGTVTGIINTFKMITVFGSSDVKSLSGGISEALITTKWGLIVAIPSLLLHAYLSRKARGVIADMETSAVSFVNALPAPAVHARLDAVRLPGVPLPDERAAAATLDPDMVRAQVHDIVREILAPLSASQINGGSTVRQA